MSWQDQARCRGVDPAIFFPERGEAAVLQAAKRLCSECNVIDECRAYALEAREPMGIWGGMSAREREKVLGSRLQGRAAFTHAGLRTDLIEIQRHVHGTESSYRHGCHCDTCKAGHAGYVRERRDVRS